MNIVTIGGGNGQSFLLSAFYDYFGKNRDLGRKVSLSAIVSMSDDGRTTGKLMRAFDSELGIHLPPPGDLRRCLFSLSDSRFRKHFSLVFESLVFDGNEPIKNFSVKRIFSETVKKILVDKKDFLEERFSESEFGENFENSEEVQIEEKLENGEKIEKTKRIGKLKNEKIKNDFENFLHSDFYEHIKTILGDFLDFKIPLEEDINGHKCGNLIMAGLYVEKGKFGSMIQRIHKLMKVPFDVIPVTMNKANIVAETDQGEIIETQDAISNAVDYEGRIESLELMDCSKESNLNPFAGQKILEADYIFIGPGDIFTSIGANFLFPKTKEFFKKTKAKIYFIANSTNKKGEASGFGIIDFKEEIAKFLGRNIDGIFVNNKKIEFSEEEKRLFKGDISVKGGDLVYLSDIEKDFFRSKGIRIIESDLLDKKDVYRYNGERLMGKIFEEIFYSKKDDLKEKFFDFFKSVFG